MVTYDTLHQSLQAPVPHVRQVRSIVFCSTPGTIEQFKIEPSLIFIPENE